ncbi:MAG: hypothetical protein R3A80_00955 [Bdellovibrionota bacterium]
MRTITFFFYNLFFLFTLSLAPHIARATADNVDNNATPVNPIVSEVNAIQTLKAAEEALEDTQLSIHSYQSTLRQLGRGLYFDNWKDTEAAIKETEGLIYEQRRKEKLLREKIATLEMTYSTGE